MDHGQTLGEVRGRDASILAMLDYTAREVADLIGPVTEKASIGGGNFEHTAPNGKRYFVTVNRSRGTQECPWKDKVDFSKSYGGMDMLLSERNTDSEPVRIPGLLRHLIESHEFFEGGSYRVSPEKIVEMFGTERIPGSFKKVAGFQLIRRQILPEPSIWFDLP